MPDPVNPRSFEALLKRANMPDHVAEQFRSYVLPFDLRDGQVVALQCGLYWDRFGLYHDTRTGKTIIMVLLSLFYLKYGLKSVFLLPPVLFDQVKAEFGLVSGHSTRIEFLEGGSTTKRKRLTEWALDKDQAPDVLLTTDDMFSGPRTKDQTRYWKLFAQFASCLFYDECQNGLQSETSNIFGAIESFLRAAYKPRLTLSTGTPITTELEAAYPAIRLKTPEAYTSRTHFDNYHVIRQPINVKYKRNGRELTTRIQKIVGYRNAEMLTMNLYKKSHRVSKFDVLNFAEPNVQIIPVTLSKKHYNAYKTLITEAVIEVEDKLIDLREQNGLFDFANRLITSPEYAGIHIKDNAVIEAVKTIARTANVGKGGKLVVFANYNSSVKFIYDSLSQFNPAIIYGGEGASGERNRAEVAKFKTDSSCGIAVINPDAGGVGLTLGDVCQFAVYAEPLSSPGKFEQSSARIILDGQTEPSVVYLLCVAGTWHNKIIRRLITKTEEIRSVMTDRKTMLSFLIEE